MENLQLITNVQLKSNSNIFPTITMDIFKGFLSLAFKVSSQNYLDEEITFLIGIFTKNGHSRTKLEKITR